MKKMLVAMMLLSGGLLHGQVKNYGNAFRKINKGYTVLSVGTVWQ